MADLSQRLSLIVDAAGDGAEATFKKIATSAENAAKTARTTGTDVAQAADKVAQARLKEADAYGRLRVEEQRLTDLRNKGNAASGQLAAAEERVASAMRRVQAAAADTARATETHSRAEREAADAAAASGDAASRSSRGWGELRGAAQGLLGLGVVAWAQGAVRQFTDSALAAQQLAASMNATTEQGGQLATLFQTMGLDAADLLEIQAEFAQQAGSLGDIGVQMQRNADGTVNWATTLTDTLGALQKIPDATERNRLGFQFFGEEGYKQLSRLITSGVSVEDALARIGFPIDDEDVAQAQEFQEQITELQIASADFGRTIGRLVLPVLSGAMDVFGTVADVIGEIPTPMLLAAGAAVALGRGWSILGPLADPIQGGLQRLRDGFANYNTQVDEVGRRTATLNTAFAGLRGSVSSGVAALGGPLGIALLAATTAYSFAQQGAEDFAESTRDAARELTDSSGVMTKNADDIHAAAEALVENAGAWENATASAKGYAAATEETGLPDWLTDLAGGGQGSGIAAIAGLFGETELATAGAEEGINEAAEALKGYDAQTEETQTAQKGLNDLIAEGTTRGPEFAAAVRTAADAQAASTYTSDLAKAAIEAYNATTRDAVNAQWEWITARYAAEDANFGFLAAMDAANTATDDAATSVDEVREAQVNLMNAAMRSAEEQANAAVEAAQAAGTVVDATTEANIRADAMISDLRSKLDTPGLGEGARTEIQGIIDQLVTAKDSGDIEAILTLTGAEETEGQLDAATEDREAHINVESRGGPAVDAYLGEVAGRARLAIVRVESRGGPAVTDYLERIRVAERLAIIRVESRNGPNVRDYLNSLAQGDRLAIVRVESRGGPAVDAYLDNLASNFGRGRTAVISTRNAPGAGGGGTGLNRAAPVYTAAGGQVRVASATIDLQLTGSIDRAQLSRAERGRAVVSDIRAYERQSGTGWRR